jgi:hypothetical protein
LQMCLHIADVPGIELLVEQGVEQDFGFGASHVGSPSSAIHALRSMDRARANRDIIVPKRISRSTMASRNGSGSSATRWRIVSASL